ncbi:MAG: hypothetical protein OEZ13_11880 [Spirochaetia bacterium]|nr:hypothetical protein [Spirochaetia bacterium]
MKNEKITGSTIKFQKILKHYMKHKGLQIELTLKNGSHVTVGGNRKLEEDSIVHLYRGKEDFRVPLSEIKKADIYAI